MVIKFISLRQRECIIRERNSNQSNNELNDATENKESRVSILHLVQSSREVSVGLQHQRISSIDLAKTLTLEHDRVKSKGSVDKHQTELNVEEEEESTNIWLTLSCL